MYPRLLPALLLAGAGCVIDAPDEPLAKRPPIAAVRISPAALTVEAGGSQQFAATVVGAGAVPQAVTWSVRAGSDAPPAGAIDAQGLYRVDAPLATPAREYVVATSVADGSIFAEAAVDLPALSVTVTPLVGDLLLGGSMSFSASIAGIANKAPEWSCSAGTIDAKGAYVAPQEPLKGEASITVRAAGLAGSQDIPSGSAEARVRLHLPPPLLTGASGPVRPFDTLVIFGSGFLASTPGIFRQVLFEDTSGNLGGTNPYGVEQDRFFVQVPAGVWSGRLLLVLGAGSEFELVRSNMLDAGLPP